MKYSVAAAALAAFVGAANAQSACLSAANSIPPCAIGYVVDAASSIGQCGIVDFACQCSHSSAIQAAIQNTILSVCGNSAVQVLNAVGGVCSCVSTASGTIALNAVESSCAPSAYAIPACGLGYFASAGMAVGNCALYDFGCQCSNQAAIAQTVLPALSSACGASANAVVQSAEALCSCVGGGSGAAATGAASGSASGAASAASTGSSAPKATSAAMQTGATMSAFTGGAATLGSFGGVFALLMGLVAYL